MGEVYQRLRGKGLAAITTSKTDRTLPTTIPMAVATAPKAKKANSYVLQALRVLSTYIILNHTILYTYYITNSTILYTLCYVVLYCISCVSGLVVVDLTPEAAAQQFRGLRPRSEAPGARVLRRRWLWLSCGVALLG